jgi:hypothetical protein
MENYLDEKNIEFSIEAVSVSIVYKQLIDLSIFEKYIIKIIKKLEEENINISLSDVLEKISNVLYLDEEIVSKNIILLSEAGHIVVNNNLIVLNHSENLNNFQKESFVSENIELILSTNKLKEFKEFEENKKIDCIKQRIDKNKIFNSCESIEYINKKIILNSKIYLNENNEFDFLFEKDNKKYILEENL